MSIFSSIVKNIAPVAATLGKFIPGIGTAVSLAGTAATAYYAAKQSAPPVAPGGGFQAQMVAPGMSLGSLGSLGRVSLPALSSFAGGAVRVGVAGARRVYSAAAGYCRKHPQWCSTIGGIAAVEAMIGRGELPIPKRRRGKGISATELKNFKRVAKFTSKYCAPVHRAMRAPAVRGGKSCR